MKKKIALLLMLIPVVSCTKVIRETIENTVYEIVEVPVETEDGNKTMAYSVSLSKSSRQMSRPSTRSGSKTPSTGLPAAVRPSM